MVCEHAETAAMSATAAASHNRAKVCHNVAHVGVSLLRLLLPQVSAAKHDDRNTWRPRRCGPLISAVVRWMQEVASTGVIQSRLVARAAAISFRTLREKPHNLKRTSRGFRGECAPVIRLQWRRWVELATWNLCYLQVSVPWRCPHARSKAIGSGCCVAPRRRERFGKRRIEDAKIPASLRPWAAWVLDGEEGKNARCPAHVGDDDLVCAWPARLVLDLADRGDRFSQEWTIFRSTFVSLPGDKEHWPRQIKLAMLLS